MKKIFSAFVVFACFLSQSSIAQQKASPEAEAFYNKAMSQINKKHVVWIKSTAKNTNEKKLEEADIKKLASQYATAGSLANGDIDALVMLVMMEANKSVYNDIKKMMEEMEATRKKKEAMRNAIQTLKDREADNKEMPRYEYDSIAKLKIKGQVKPQTVTSNVYRVDTAKKARPVAKVTKAELGQLQKDLKDKLDSMSEMGEMESLRLQMAMDRMSKMMSTLSNLLKKFSDTQNSIIQNLK